MQLSFDPSWMVGFALATTRTGAFVTTSLFPGRFLPPMGRRALTLALGLFFTVPVALPPTDDDWVTSLVVLAAANVIAGAAVGWVVGAVVHLFSIAGSVLDFTGGLYSARLFDPNAGGQVGPFEQLLGTSAVVAIALSGGMLVPVWALWASLRVFGLDASVGTELAAHMSEAAVTLLRSVTLGGVELVLPAVAVLIVLEATFGLAARIAPQANVLLISLPAKLLVVFTVAGAVMVTFPEAVSQAVELMEQSLTSVLAPFA